MAGVLFGLAGLIGLLGGVALLGQSLFALLTILLAVIYLALHGRAVLHPKRSRLLYATLGRYSLRQSCRRWR